MTNKAQPQPAAKRELRKKVENQSDNKLGKRIETNVRLID